MTGRDEPTLDNETYIAVPEDASEEEKERIELLNRYNEDRLDKRRNVDTNKEIEIDNIHTIEAISSSLRLTDGQKSRAKFIFKEEVENLGRGIEEVAFACCVIAANEDVEGKRYWPDSDDNDELFEEVVENLDLNPLPSLNMVKEKVR